ncbi:MAG: c-type cytochrome, partial [Phycisphaerae bacterium]
EARGVTTFLLSRRDPAVTEHVRVDYAQTPAGKIARGRALARRLNCIGCHTIEGGGEATIHQYYTSDTNVDDNYPFGPRFKPPLLWGEGAKIQYDWLFRFLNNVEMLRPWLNARMPSFYLTPEDATTLVEYFAGLAQDESGFLNEYLIPIEKHIQQADAIGGDANWFALDKFSDSAAFLRRYALTHQQVGPYDFDTSQAADAAEESETLADAFTKVTSRGRFLANLFDVAYPFSDPESHAIDDGRFKLGEEFFFDQKCLSCHVAGDPSVPGTTTEIKAPNFALTHKRLRYDWLYKWLQDPQAIQPGANMPQIFQGGTAHASLPEADRKKKEAKFFDTMDLQARLLLDFLVAVGERRYTAIQPGALEEAGKAAEEGEPEFDFDADESDAEEEEFDFD